MNRTVIHPALALLPRPSEKWESTSALAPWRTGHEQAVAQHLMGELTGREEAILALGDGIATYIANAPHEWPSAYETEHFAPAIDAFASMLDCDLGRLDAGTLSSWASKMYQAIGWDYELGELS